MTLRHRFHVISQIKETSIATMEMMMVIACAISMISIFIAIAWPSIYQSGSGVFDEITNNTGNTYGN